MCDAGSTALVEDERRKRGISIFPTYFLGGPSASLLPTFDCFLGGIEHIFREVRVKSLPISNVGTSVDT